MAEIIQQISIWSILVPLTIGLYRFKRAGYQFRLFTLFLVIGFVTDITMYGLFRASQGQYLKYILSIYSLIEAMVFFWFVRQYLANRTWQRISTYLFFATPPIWLSITIFRLILLDRSPGKFFDPFYEVCISFLAGFALLQMVERHSAVTKAPAFWILLAMFFYCFCTFFFMALLYSEISMSVWFVNNLINTMTYCLYAVGLWKANTKD